MNRRFTANVLSLSLASALLLSSCQTTQTTAPQPTQTQAPTSIVNGDFEESASDGGWLGWTREDAAFNARGIVSEPKQNGVEMDFSGSKYFSGLIAGNPVMRGTLTSDPFTLGDTGFILFRMGAGQNPDKVYVEFLEEGTDTVLAKVTNEDADGVFITDHLLSKVVDLSAHIGKTIYIKVTDTDDTEQLSYVNLDDFRVAKSQDEINSAKQFYETQLEEFGPKPFEEDETLTTIQNPGFETGDLTGWQLLGGNAFTAANVIPSSQMHWEDRSAYAAGEFYLDGSNNGATKESAVGAIRSSKFTLAGDGFISFMMGAGNGDSYVAIVDAETEEELMKIKNDSFSDPARALTLIRTYVDASDYLNKVLYLKVVDANDAEGGFAFLNVDDFHVSLTKAEASALAVAQLESVQAETYTSAKYDDLNMIRDFYLNYDYPFTLDSLVMSQYIPAKVSAYPATLDLNAYLAEAEAKFGDTVVEGLEISKVTFGETETATGFDAFSVEEEGYYHVTYGTTHEGKDIESSFTIIASNDETQVLNGGFEAGNLSGWEVLTDIWQVQDGKYLGVISAESYWNEALPYNQAGAYHLDGWSNGIPEGETWQLKSGTFTLGGSGFISVRMGGNAAAVRVYKADGTEVGYYKQSRFADQNFPSLAQGGSWADMGTYVMDLRDYLGEELYLVLCDEQVEGWAQSFFDEVVTNYPEAPDYQNLVDEVKDGGTGDPVEIPWQLAANQL